MVINDLYESYRKLHVIKRFEFKNKVLESEVRNKFREKIEDMCKIEDLEKVLVFTENKINLKRLIGSEKGAWKPIMVLVTDKSQEKIVIESFTSVIVVIINNVNNIDVLDNVAYIECNKNQIVFYFDKIKNFLIKVIEPGEVRDYTKSKLSKIFYNSSDSIKVKYLCGKEPFDGEMQCYPNRELDGSEGKIYYSSDNKWLFKMYKMYIDKDKIDKLKTIMDVFESESEVFILATNIIKDSNENIGIQLRNLGSEYINLSNLCGSIHKYYNNTLMYKDYIDIGIKISSYIKKLHKKGYKHGDIHFNNFMYNMNNKEVALIDLDSIAKIEEHLDSKGLWGFKAPENVKEEPITIYSDYYSLGILMAYLMLFRNVMQPTKIFDFENQLNDYTIGYGEKLRFIEVDDNDKELLRISEPVIHGGQLSYSSLPLEVKVLIEKNCVLGIDRKRYRPNPNEWVYAFNRVKKKLISCKNCEQQFFISSEKCPFCNNYNMRWEKMNINEGEYIANEYELQYFDLDNIPNVIVEAMKVFNNKGLEFLVRGGISLALNGIKSREVSDIDIVLRVSDEIKLLECLENIGFTISYREITAFNEIRYTIFWKVDKYVKMEIILTDKDIPSRKINAEHIDSSMNIVTADYLIFTKLYKVVNILCEHKVSKKNHIHAKEIIDLIPYTDNKIYMLERLKDRNIDFNEFSRRAIYEVAKYVDCESLNILKIFLGGEI